MPEVSRKRGGELLRGVFSILMGHAEGLRRTEVLARLEREVPPTEHEAADYPNRPGVRRYEKIVQFRTVGAVKAGWMIKEKGRWSLTPDGRWAFEELSDPDEFMQEVGRLYREWRRNSSEDLPDADLPVIEIERLDTEADFDDEDLDDREPPGVRATLTARPDRTGSAPLFKKVDLTLEKLIQDIRMGEIGLPDIQRPFIWPNRKVRDLFDSMYRGYPVGYLLFWTPVVDEGYRQVGVDEKQKVPHLVIETASSG